VQELFRRLKDCLSPKTGQPVLYEEAYEGLYCEGCESFKTDKDLDDQGRCPGTRSSRSRSGRATSSSGSPSTTTRSSSHFEAHPDFIWRIIDAPRS